MLEEVYRFSNNIVTHNGHYCWNIEYEQFDLLTGIEELEKEKRVKVALVEIQLKCGKNTVLDGMNLEEKATQRKGNELVGSHKIQRSNTTCINISFS